jgi:hypothetical protein
LLQQIVSITEGLETEICVFPQCILEKLLVHFQRVK